MRGDMCYRLRGDSSEIHLAQVFRPRMCSHNDFFFSEVNLVTHPCCVTLFSDFLMANIGYPETGAPLQHALGEKAQNHHFVKCTKSK